MKTCRYHTCPGETSPKVGQGSPWGIIQTATPLGTSGAVFVSTSSHGGAWIPSEARNLFPEQALSYASRWSKGNGSQWFEEDVAIAAVVVYLPQAGFSEDSKEQARETYKSYIEKG